MRFSPFSPNRAVHSVLAWLTLLCFLSALFCGDGARHAASPAGMALPDHCASPRMRAGHGAGEEQEAPLGKQTREAENGHCLLCVAPGLPGAFVRFVPGIFPLARWEHLIPVGQAVAAPDRRHAPSRAPPLSLA